MLKILRIIYLVCSVLVVNVLYAEQNRYALIIGNAAYKDNPLKNPVNDALAISKILEKKNFDVTHIQNATKREMEEAIRDFTKKLKLNTVGLFYYAGHGIEVDGKNYLIPIRAFIETEDDAIYEAVSLNRILDRMDRASYGLNIVILDACRNNPYSRKFRSANNGLAITRPPSGTIILYATEPGNVAADGAGEHGLFTEQLLGAINDDELTVEEAFKKTARSVHEITGGEQVPWYEGVILGHFYFGKREHTPRSPILQNAQSDKENELVFWKSVESNPTIGGYQAYLDTYPEGGFVTLAKVRIEELKSNKGRTFSTAINNGVAQQPDSELLDQAKAVGSEGGKYEALLQILNCPRDKMTYGDHYDYGFWGGGPWCDQPGSAGYWVWDAPNWYIWQSRMK